MTDDQKNNPQPEGQPVPVEESQQAAPAGEAAPVEESPAGALAAEEIRYLGLFSGA